MLTVTNTPQIRYFDNDEDFYNYCVDPRVVAMQSDKGYYYTTFNFTPQYIEDVENGIRFMIKDENSQIFKRGCVSLGLMNRDVENLEQYFAD